MEYQRTATGSLIHVVPFVGEDGTPLSRFFFVAQDVRRERTGVHGKITLAFSKADQKNATILSYDTFNIGRNEERRRLAKSGHAALCHGQVEMADLFPLEHCYHLLDVFCNGLWDEVVGSIEVVDEGGEITGPPPMLLSPFLLEGGGTLLFSAPGQGKSNTALMMAVSVDAGCQQFWRVSQCPVLYINLERSPGSMRARLGRVNRALGLPESRTLAFIHGRGRTLKDVHEAVLKAVRKRGVGLVVLDSVSRAGQGNLNDNEVGNGIIDMLNAYPSWLGIAHAARGDERHTFGSVMFAAGADVELQLVSEKMGDHLLGVSLSVVKANDIPWASETWAYQFDQGGLTTVRRAGPGEFGELESRRSGPETLKETVVRWLRDCGEGYASQIASDLGQPDKTAEIIRLLQGDGFVFSHHQDVRNVRQAFYRLA